MNPNLHTSPEHEFEAQLGLPEKLPKYSLLQQVRQLHRS